MIISMSGEEEYDDIVSWMVTLDGILCMKKNPTYQEMVSKKLKIINNSSLDRRRFVENYLPQHKEVGNWVVLSFVS